MLAARHDLPPSMTMQDKVDLTIADRMIYCSLVCLGDLTDLHQLTFFCTFLKRCQNGCFFGYTHIAVIATVVIAGDCFDSVIPILCHKASHRTCMEACCCGYLPGICSFCTEFQCFQSGLDSLILVILTSLFNFLDLFFTKFVSGSHIHHPDTVYHIIARNYTVLLRISISREQFRIRCAELEPKIQQLQQEIESLAEKVQAKEVVDHSEKLTVLQYALEQYTNINEGQDVPESVIEAFVVKIVVSKDGFDWYLRFDGDPDKPRRCTLQGKRKTTTKIMVSGENYPTMDCIPTG